MRLIELVGLKHEKGKRNRHRNRKRGNKDRTMRLVGVPHLSAEQCGARKWDRCGWTGEPGPLRACTPLCSTRHGTTGGNKKTNKNQLERHKTVNKWWSNEIFQLSNERVRRAPPIGQTRSTDEQTLTGDLPVSTSLIASISKSLWLMSRFCVWPSWRPPPASAGLQMRGAVESTRQWRRLRKNMAALVDASILIDLESRALHPSWG